MANPLIVIIGKPDGVSAKVSDLLKDRFTNIKKAQPETDATKQSIGNCFKSGEDTYTWDEVAQSNLIQLDPNGYRNLIMGKLGMRSTVVVFIHTDSDKVFAKIPTYKDFLYEEDADPEKIVKDIQNQCKTRCFSELIPRKESKVNV